MIVLPPSYMVPQDSSMAEEQHRLAPFEILIAQTDCNAVKGVCV